MKYFLLSLSLLISLSTLGQNFKKTNYDIGFGTTAFLPFKNEYQRYSHDPSVILKQKVGFGYFLGGQYTHNFTQKYGVSVGIDYVQYRYKSERYDPYAETHGKRRVSYLRLPVTFNYLLFEKVKLSVGTFAAYCIDTREKGTGKEYLQGSPETKDWEYDVDMDVAYAKFDLGLTSKVRYEIHILSNITTSIFTKFNIGLFDAFYTGIEPKEVVNPWRNMDLNIGWEISL